MPRRTDGGHAGRADTPPRRALTQTEWEAKLAAERTARREARGARKATREAARQAQSDAARRRKRQARRAERAERAKRAYGWHAGYTAALHANPSNNREHGHAGGHVRPQPPKPRRQRGNDLPPAGPVTIRRPDGTTEVQPAHPSSTSSNRRVRRHRP
jgi:hypothetical protein